MRLVFIHGLLCNSTDWYGQVNAFSELGIEESIAIELPDSTSPGELGNESFISYAANYVNQFKRQSQSTKCSTIFVGHSMGCRIALEAVYQDSQDVAGLILIEGSSRMTENSKEVADHILSLSNEKITDFLQTEFNAMFSRATPDSFRKSILERIDNVNHAYAARLLADMTKWDSVQAQKAIQFARFPELRGAPLAAHSKKQKAAEDEKARKSAINDEQSHHSMQLIPASHAQQATNVEPASTFELSLNDFLNMDTPPSNELISRASKRLSSRSASGNATPSTIEPVSQEESSQAMTAWLNSSILPFAQQQREGETIASIGSPFPQFLLDDWMSSDMINSLGNTSNGIATNTGLTPRIMSPFQGIRDEDRALKSLASFYAAFCMTTTGENFVAKTGQVLNISNGAALQFNSPTKARVFYVAKRGRLP
ncbi:hypothetical protein L7F22_067909 [Adiantum nelumboides]|nr:hypothetical protein [Adiantum nelumboides]